MPIGSSTGEVYKDEFDFINSAADSLLKEQPLSRGPRIEITPAASQIQPPINVTPNMPTLRTEPQVDPSMPINPRELPVREQMDKIVGRVASSENNAPAGNVEPSSPIQTEGFFNWLFGSSDVPKAEVKPAPARSAFPTDEEARSAQQYGFGEGSGHEAYINQQAARIYGQMRTMQLERGVKKFFKPEYVDVADLDKLMPQLDSEAQSKNVDLTSPEFKDIKDRIGLTFAKSALVLNRIPLGALGFEPSKVVFDTELARLGAKATISGAYGRSLGGAVYSNLQSPGNVVHESIHKGIDVIRTQGTPEAKQALRELQLRMPEEMIVRYLMATAAGDPENPHPERNAAMDLFKGVMGPTYIKQLNKLQEEAQKMLAKRRPAGGHASDETPDAIKPGQQYAMEWKKLPGSTGRQLDIPAVGGGRGSTPKVDWNKVGEQQIQPRENLFPNPIKNTNPAEGGPKEFKSPTEIKARVDELNKQLKTERSKPKDLSETELKEFDKARDLVDRDKRKELRSLKELMKAISYLGE